MIIKKRDIGGAELGNSYSSSTRNNPMCICRFPRTENEKLFCRLIRSCISINFRLVLCNDDLLQSIRLMNTGEQVAIQQPAFFIAQEDLFSNEYFKLGEAE